MAELHQALAEADDDDARAAAFRRFKDREVFRAGFRAILAPESAPETLADELSDAAEVLLTGGLRGRRRCSPRLLAAPRRRPPGSGRAVRPG